MRTTLTVLAALGSGVVGGALFAFSGFVMHGLERLPPERALAAMNAINRSAPRAPFLLPLFGTAAACVALGVLTVRAPAEPGTGLVLAGSALSLASFVITVAFHVPRNDALAREDPSAPGAAAAWASYRGPWVAGNHVRVVASLGGGTLLILSLLPSAAS